MRITNIDLFKLKMPLKEIFETSMGVETHREFLLLVAHGDSGLMGLGECTAMDIPCYNYETNDTAWHILETYLIPEILNKEINHPKEFTEQFAWIRGHEMAKATLEGALWDLYAKEKRISLSAALGGKRKKIDVGISIGIEKNLPKLMEDIQRYLEQGYMRLKLKIKPGYDLEPIEAIRRKFGDIPLMADANSAYTMEDLPLFKALDDYGLLMIEQPLAYHDIIDHRKLQNELATPICLDESIHSVEDARKAIELGSCKIINIKVGRVGGLYEAKKIHDLCEERGIPVWCGGMQESGVGRAHNIAITSLNNFTIPGDTSPSDRYWERDIISPAISFSEPGVLSVPEAPGIGYELDYDAVRRYLVESKRYA